MYRIINLLPLYKLFIPKQALIFPEMLQDIFSTKYWQNNYETHKDTVYICNVTTRQLIIGGFMHNNISKLDCAQRAQTFTKTKMSTKGDL